MKDSATRSESVLAFRCCEESGAHPVGEGLSGPFGGGREGGVFVVGGAEAFDVAAGVVDGWASGSGAHDMRIAATESIDNTDFSGHNKYMIAKTERRDLYDADGRDISTYCETCYEAPQVIEVELSTTSAKDPPATSIAAFIVTCSGCQRTARIVPGAST